MARVKFALNKSKLFELKVRELLNVQLWTGHTCQNDVKKVQVIEKKARRTWSSSSRGERDKQHYVLFFMEWPDKTEPAD